MAVVLHIDVDAFFASVAQLDDPSLVGRPVAVGERVVAAASYPARAAGVRAAMSMVEARRLCPGLVVVPPDMDRYQQCSEQVFGLVAARFPGAALEQVSIDEAFLDISGWVADPEDAAGLVSSLRQEVRLTVGLTTSVGVASSKLVAKVASDVAKPDGQMVVPTGGEVAFLSPLPVSDIPGIGPRTTTKLGFLGVRRVEDLVRVDPAVLVNTFGEAVTSRLLEVMRGQDSSTVQPRPPASSLSSQKAFEAPLRDLDVLVDVLDMLVVSVARRVASDGRLPNAVSVKVRWSDYQAVTSRQVSLQMPSADTVSLAGAARVAVASLVERIVGEGVTMVGVAAVGLGEDGVRQPTVLAPELLFPPTGPLELTVHRRSVLQLLMRCVPGVEVRHPTFGVGVVKRVAGTAVTVAFEGRERVLDATRAPLVALNGAAVAEGQ